MFSKSKVVRFLVLFCFILFYFVCLQHLLLLLRVRVNLSLHHCSDYTISGRVKCENKVRICRRLKWNLLIIALGWIVKEGIMLPTVSEQFVQMVVQGWHNPNAKKVRSSRCRRLRYLIRHYLLLFPVHYFGNSGSPLCLSGFDDFQQLYYSAISDSALYSANVCLLEGNVFCVNTQMKLSHHLYLIGKKA